MLKNIYELNNIKSDNYRDIDENAVLSLVESIKAVGLQEPIRLFQVEDSEDLFVISGHHRLEALRRVKRDPDYSHQVFQAIITTGTIEQYKSQKTAIHSVLANMIRTDLGILDRAAAYNKLKKTGISAAQIGKMVGKDKRTIEMTLNIGLLPPEAVKFVRTHPKLKDSFLYKEAVKIKKDASYDIMSSLKQSASKERKRAGATIKQSKKWNPKIFSKKLKETQIFSEDQINLILNVFESNL